MVNFVWKVGDSWNNCTSECIITENQGRDVTVILTTEDGCLNGGSCNADNLCDCMPGFLGFRCSISLYDLIT